MQVVLAGLLSTEEMTPKARRIEALRFLVRTQIERKYQIDVEEDLKLGRRLVIMADFILMDSRAEDTSNAKRNKTIAQITNIRSYADLRAYLEEHPQLNLSTLVDSGNSTLLHHAAFRKDCVRLRAYMEHFKQYFEMSQGKALTRDKMTFAMKIKAWVNVANHEGSTALHYAALHGDLEMITTLEDAGINLHYRSNEGENALFMCAKNNRVKALIYLCQPEKKYDLNETNNKGENILHKACEKGCFASLSYLVTLPINKNLQDLNGFTPLMVSTKESHRDCMKRLIIKGALLDVATLDGTTALSIAQEMNRPDLMSILQKKFTFMEKVKIWYNTKTVYTPEDPSLLQPILATLFNILLLASVALLDTFLVFSQSWQEWLCEGAYFALLAIFFFSSMIKAKKKQPQNLVAAALPICAECQISERVKSVHCFICKRCIYRYDHHCPWINNCVGFHNIGKFTILLLLFSIEIIFVLFCHICVIFGLLDDIISTRELEWLNGTPAQIVRCIMMVVALLTFPIIYLLINQCRTIVTNTTNFEESKKTHLSGSVVERKELLSSAFEGDDNPAPENFSEEENSTIFRNCSAMLCSES